MDKPSKQSEPTSRRTLLKGVPTAALAAAAVGAIARPGAAHAQTKISHEAAKYQDKPNNGQECSTCVQFEAPSSCKIVASPISPQGWCQFYTKKP